ncbi:MAG: sporulation initiation factor Spo0A C-terminal domain-containing protein [Eubacterium sp.]
MRIQECSKKKSGPDGSAAIRRICFPGGSGEFSQVELLRHLSASEMIGCRYFCDALKIYAECLQERAACVLQNDVYPELSEIYETSDVCIETAIRRWIVRSWKSPEMRRFFFESTNGEITRRPTTKRLLHLMARSLVFGEFQRWNRQENRGILAGNDLLVHKQKLQSASGEEKMPVRYYSSASSARRRKKGETLPFYMRDCGRTACTSDKVGEP